MQFFLNKKTDHRSDQLLFLLISNLKKNETEDLKLATTRDSYFFMCEVQWSIHLAADPMHLGDLQIVDLLLLRLFAADPVVRKTTFVYKLINQTLEASKKDSLIGYDQFLKKHS